ncbi:MAG TPA: NnrS family protein [Bryobacteraceae bacterium]|nr:NnrS family protein [Bryobacteraceae bacterium]
MGLPDPRTVWATAARRPAPNGADPLPERRLARLLGAFIASGLAFLVLPGTLLGVWNLLRISSRQDVHTAPSVWIQAHGHAQLFGWVATFIVGISLYTVPKFRGAMPRSLAAGWLMLALWTAAVAARWASALWDWHWRTIWPAAAAAELAVAVLLLWQASAKGRRPRTPDVASVPIFAGMAGFIVTMAVHLVLVWPPLAAPLIPEGPNSFLLTMALWWFCFPVVWGFSLRFLPPLVGLRKSGSRPVWAGLALLPAGLFYPPFIVAAVAAACWSLGIFHPPSGKPKVLGVDRRYPVFVRLAFGWLAVAALMGALGSSRGIVGAGRHAFTVGFLATMIFAVGPRILPSFLNSRELWSTRLMLAAMALLTAGCALRVGSEPLAYAGVAPWAWSVLPVSAVVELTAVVLFAVNIGATLVSPMPAWILPRTVHENLPLYWYVTSYPATRPLLERAGLRMLGQVREVPRALTLREAAEAEGVDWHPLVDLLRDFFVRRQARALRDKP